MQTSSAVTIKMVCSGSTRGRNTFTTRWRYDRAEPSEKYIRYTQIEGIFMAVAGAVFLVVLLFFPPS